MNTEPQESNPRPVARAPRWTGLTLALAAIALVMVLAPAAQAASLGGPATITIHAPYTGATSYQSTSTSSSGCGSGHVPRAPSFDATDGVASSSVRASAQACNPSAGDTGGAATFLEVMVPISVYNGNNWIHAKWTVKATVTAHVGAADCYLTNSTYSYCLSEAYASFDTYTYLIDQTNGSSWYVPANWGGVEAYSYVYDLCFEGNCSLSVTPNQHIAIDQSVNLALHADGLNASHSYVLETIFGQYASAYDYVYGGTLYAASEQASVSMAGSGNGATLDWITIH
jgi:hypothetical protein